MQKEIEILDFNNEGLLDTFWNWTAHIPIKLCKLKVDIWSKWGGAYKPKEDEKPNIIIGRSEYWNRYIILATISSNPKIIAKTPNMTDEQMKNLEQGIKYVSKNYDLFLKHYNNQFNDEELFKALKEREYNMKRLGSKFENHTMKDETLKKFKNNKLIKEIIKEKEIDNKKLYYTIRKTDNMECVAVYINGIAIYLILKGNDIYLYSKRLSIEKKITDMNMYREELKNIVKKLDTYQNEKNEMKEKIFQHNLIENINDVKSLNKKYGKITIIDEELFIFLTEYKERKEPKGRVDLVGVSEKGKLLFIEVKIDGSVILGKNGINKHCYDIMKYCKNAKYKKEDLNKWICQLNSLFERDIPLIKNDNPDFIILCGYNKESKYDVIDQIAEIISDDMIESIKKCENWSNIVQVEENKPDSVKTLKEHFVDIKKNNPSLILAEVNNNKVIKDCEVNKPRINYVGKPWHIIRTSLISLTEKC